MKTSILESVTILDNTGNSIGPDKVTGCKYLILPSGYEGDFLEGFYVFISNIYKVWCFIRSCTKVGMELSVISIKENLKVYPSLQKDNSPKMDFKNMSGVYFNTRTPII